MKDEAALPLLPQRGRYQGAWQIFLFNWPFYVVGTAACLCGAAMLSLAGFPYWLNIVTGMGIALALFWLLTSLLVSFYVYDVSPLYRWQWLASLFITSPASWANIHAGLDESSLFLRTLFPTEQWQVFDIYNDTMSEPSIRRARASIPPPIATCTADYMALPVGDNTLQAVFLLFAAHEIREANARLCFFRELQRITSPQGKVILVEHLRDGANFLAFGPGFWHFLPKREWHRVIEQSGFTQQNTFRITPFVTVFVLEKPLVK